MKKLPLLLAFFMPFFLIAQIPFDSLQLIRSEKVYFDSGKFDIRPDADSVLQELLQFCQEKDQIYIHLTAHTDAIGGNNYNQVLSQNRGSSIQAFLLDNGWDKARIQVNEYGEERPETENNTEMGRQQNRRVTLDVFQQTRMIRVEGMVKDEETGEGLAADIIIRTKERRDSTQSDENGRFSFPIKDGTVFGLDIYAEGHFFDTRMVKALVGKLPPIEVELPPANKGETADIKNLFFVGNQAVLLKKSKPELPKVLKFMEINPKIRIEIAGHINYPNSPDVPKESWDFKLSVRRAKMVYDYLLENGINPERIQYKGYGNSQMRYPKGETLEKQAQNRRVEIRILESLEQKTEQ